MTDRNPQRGETLEEWPNFGLRYTESSADFPVTDMCSDGIVVFDATKSDRSSHWIAAEIGSFVTIENVR